MVIVCDCLQRCLPFQNGLVWPSCCDMWILTSLDAECHHWPGTNRPSRRSRTCGAAWARSNQVGGAQHLPGPWGLLGQKRSRMSRDVKSKAGFSGCYHRSNSVPGSALLAVEGCFFMVLQVSFSDFFSGISTWIVEPFVTVITPSSAALPWTFFVCDSWHRHSLALGCWRPHCPLSLPATRPTLITSRDSLEWLLRTITLHRVPQQLVSTVLFFLQLVTRDHSSSSSSSSILQQTDNGHW